MNCVGCGNKLCIRKIPLFSSLSEEDLKKISSRMTFMQYKKGETILYRGKVPGGITIICKGSAKAYRLAPDGGEKILYIYSSHDYFGEQYLFSGKRSGYAVVALQETDTAFFSKKHFQELIFAYPALAASLIEELGRRTLRLENMLQAAGSQKTEARIAALLLDFMKKYGNPGKRGTEIKLPVSREGMANYLGIARETLSRKLSSMKREGIIHFEGGKKLMVLKPGVLAKMADMEIGTPFTN